MDAVLCGPLRGRGHHVPGPAAQGVRKHHEHLPAVAGKPGGQPELGAHPGVRCSEARPEVALQGAWRGRHPQCHLWHRSDSHGLAAAAHPTEGRPQRRGADELEGRQPPPFVEKEGFLHGVRQLAGHLAGGRPGQGLALLSQGAARHTPAGGLPGVSVRWPRRQRRRHLPPLRQGPLAILGGLAAVGVPGLHRLECRLRLSPEGHRLHARPQRPGHYVNRRAVHLRAGRVRSPRAHPHRAGCPPGRRSRPEAESAAAMRP